MKFQNDKKKRPLKQSIYKLKGAGLLWSWGEGKRPPESKVTRTQNQ